MNVTYGPSGLELQATSCTVQSDSVLSCMSSPGLSTGHAFIARVAGVPSTQSIVTGEEAPVLECA